MPPNLKLPQFVKRSLAQIVANCSDVKLGIHASVSLAVDRQVAGKTPALFIATCMASRNLKFTAIPNTCAAIGVEVTVSAFVAKAFLASAPFNADANCAASTSDNLTSEA